MFCIHCGAQMDDNSRFCTKCGSPLNGGAGSDPYVNAGSASYAGDTSYAGGASYTGDTSYSGGYTGTASYDTNFGQSSDQGMNFDFDTDTVTASASVRYEYKVLSQKDKWFSGKFDPQLLEQALNAYAQQGWRVVGCATADIPSFGASRQEFVTLLEREVR